MYDFFFLYKGNFKTLLISPKFNLSIFKTLTESAIGQFKCVKVCDWGVQKYEPIKSDLCYSVRLLTNQSITKY
jgi:hypothetical protein